jgi:hypothetical protein
VAAGCALRSPSLYRLCLDCADFSGSNLTGWLAHFGVVSEATVDGVLSFCWSNIIFLLPSFVLIDRLNEHSQSRAWCSFSRALVNISLSFFLLA